MGLILGQEEPLEKEMATHSSILAWKVPWTEEPGRLQSMGSQKSRTRFSDQTTDQHSPQTSCFGTTSCAAAYRVQGPQPGGLMKNWN